MSSPTTTLITSCAGSAITARTGPTLSWPRSSPLAVREEIRSLPTELKSLVPTFQNVFEFADYPELRRGPLPGSIDGVLLSAMELAAFIKYAAHCRSQKRVRSACRRGCADWATTATTRTTLMGTAWTWPVATWLASASAC